MMQFTRTSNPSTSTTKIGTSIQHLRAFKRHRNWKQEGFSRFSWSLMFWTSVPIMRGQGCLPRFDILDTSRNLAPIAQYFGGNKKLNICASDQDVQRYIEGQIPRAGFLKRHVNKDVTLQEEIVKAIMSNVEGMLVLHLPF